ncbi:hypothetical protein LZ31DRAFT_543645 [Colletotrichum somersetense]|nr:hypothetical protein LZ31DRAFT_543645 [Colletotrichum somersetense]
MFVYYFPQSPLALSPCAMANMRHVLLSPLLLITASLYAQVIGAQPRPVRDAETLGLEIKEEGKDNIKVVGPGRFEAVIAIDRFWDQIDVTHIGNQDRAIKAREALLSTWQESTKTSASKIKHIKYLAVMNHATTEVLHSIWLARQHDDRSDDDRSDDDGSDDDGSDDDTDNYGDSYMYGSDKGEESDDAIEPTMTIERPATGKEDWRFRDLLENTPFGVGAAKMCLEFTEMQNHYIESFTIGLNEEDRNWLVINFGINK